MSRSSNVAWSQLTLLPVHWLRRREKRSNEHFRLSFPFQLPMHFAFSICNCLLCCWSPFFSQSLPFAVAILRLRLRNRSAAGRAASRAQPLAGGKREGETREEWRGSTACLASHSVLHYIHLLPAQLILHQVYRSLFSEETKDNFSLHTHHLFALIII